MPDPHDIATGVTTDFISSELAPGARILEVGCGDGRVAEALIRRGYEVVAIDADESCVSAARARGVDARCAVWPRFDCVPLDAVAFTRSLHHIAPLEPAVKQARVLLRENGLLVVEDFAVEAADDSALRWLRDVAMSPAARSFGNPPTGGLIAELTAGVDPAEAWRRCHQHEVAEFAEVLGAIEREFRPRTTTTVPYLYRYLTAVLPGDERAASLVQQVYLEEQRRGERGEIPLVGRRVVGVPRRAGSG